MGLSPPPALGYIATSMETDTQKNRPMRILLLAPHPFYQDRGTPIAVNLLLEALSGLGHEVDVLTYHEGADVSHPNVVIHRIRRPPFARGVPPGPSVKKILCDLAMAPRAVAMARRKRYDLVHAVEESVYMALWIRRRLGIPFVYDMDSSLAHQIAEKFPFLRWLLPLMAGAEGAAMRRAKAVVPVCDALADMARAAGASNVHLLRDISLLSPAAPAEVEAVRALWPRDGRTCFMYVGNLETYQGVDLMLKAFARFARTAPGAARLVLAGGKAADITRYTSMAATLGIGDSTQFLGPQPVSRLAALLDAADALVSPRAKGNNTPMKIYSYLASGKAILATDLPTHTQVLTPAVALLTTPDDEAMAAGMSRLAADATLRDRLGQAARSLADARYSAPVFRRTVAALYASLQPPR